MFDWRMLAVAGGAVVVGGGMAAIWAASQPDRYEAEVVMAVGPASTLVEDADVIDVVATLERGGVTATAAGIATSSSVKNAAADEIGLDGSDAGDYEVDAVPVQTSSLVDISVSGPDAEIVASLANATAEQLQVRFEEIYDVYEVEILSPATAPTNSARPSIALVTVLGALVALAISMAVWWAVFGGRWRKEPSPPSDP